MKTSNRVSARSVSTPFAQPGGITSTAGFRPHRTYRWTGASRDGRSQSSTATAATIAPPPSARAYPAASFAFARGEDPEGTYPTATVGVDDLDGVTDLVLDRLIAIQIEEGLPLYMVPEQPPARARARQQKYALRPTVVPLPVR